MICWICDSPDVVYVDVLDMGWCQKDFDETYLQPPPRISRGVAE